MTRLLSSIDAASSKNSISRSCNNYNNFNDNVSSNNRDDDWIDVAVPTVSAAILYKYCPTSHRAEELSSRCGHAVSLVQFAVRNLASCPICKAPVTYVEDGGVFKSLSSTQGSVLFKFGKLIYRLSVPLDTHDIEKPTTISRDNSHVSCIGQRLRWMYWGNITDADEKIVTKNKTTESGTAQGRIRSVLHLAPGMKILYKGKVLYPPTLLESNTNRQKVMEMELSMKLIELSKSDMTTPLLLVMGTPVQRQLNWLQKEQEHLLLLQQAKQSHQYSQSIKEVWTTITTITVRDVVIFTKNILYFGFRWTTQLAGRCWNVVRSNFFNGTNRETNREPSHHRD